MKRTRLYLSVCAFVYLFSSIFTSCMFSSAETTTSNENSIPEIPVVEVLSDTVVLEEYFPASIEGINSVEIRTKVDGYLSSIHIEEGDFVKKGQLLFTIDDRPFFAALRTAEAELETARAQVLKNKIEVDRLNTLLNKKLVSEIQVQMAKANLAIAEADEKRAAAQVDNTKINLAYCQIKAPVSGYLGRISFKLGSLVNSNSAAPLTILSDVHQILTYFSMSEEKFAEWMHMIPGNTVEAKLNKLPAVHLQLANGELFSSPGRIELIRGQLEKASGSFVIRARFNNPGNILRDGNTGNLLLKRIIPNALIIPQQAAMSIQDKQLVYLVNDSNKVSQLAFHSTTKTPTHYVVGKEFKKGQKIVLSGMDRLQDGMLIKPIHTDPEASN